jgi:DNA polymerase sigma
LDGSDLDLSIVSPLDQRLIDGQQLCRKGNRRNNNDPRSIFNLDHLSDILEHELETNVEAIESAVVPLCKFVDPLTGISCDLTIHNTLAMENSQLIKEYTLLDPRIRPLVYMLKHFTKRRSINDCKHKKGK